MNADILIGSVASNKKVLNYLRAIKPQTRVFAAWNAVPDAYVNCGCHPDIVEWLWDRVGPTLPGNCRGLIHGCPVLVHPESGVILAIAMGTQYGIRVPTVLRTEAIAAGATIVQKWSTGDSTDISLELGGDWLFGFGGPAQIALMGLAYSVFGLKT